VLGVGVLPYTEEGEGKQTEEGERSDRETLGKPPISREKKRGTCLWASLSESCSSFQKERKDQERKKVPFETTGIEHRRINLNIT